MAAIDKIYGTREQHDEFRIWAEKNNPDILKYLYPKEDQEGECIVIANLPEEIDKWLWENCNFDFIIERLEEQYDGSMEVLTT